MSKSKSLNKSYLKLVRKEQNAYKKFTGVMGTDAASRRTRDAEYANYLSAKSDRLNFRKNNKRIMREPVYKQQLALQ